MSEDLIGYSRLTQNALRGVVKEALKLSIDGLPGDHHFYISFKTHYKGVQLANYLAQKYPDEMTIVLQLQYEDLEVKDDYFAVTLHFGGVPQRIVVPYAAITRFYDPYARFALPFDVIEAEENNADVTEEITEDKSEETTENSEEAPENQEAQIVSLDAFRKKK